MDARLDLAAVLLERARVLHLQPDDVLLVTLNEAPDDMLHAATERLAELLPERRVIVTTRATLDIVRPDAADQITDRVR
jgi:hypothetical protein